MVGSEGIEPTSAAYQTAALPLSYGPIIFLAGSRGIEPLRPCSPTVFETAPSTNRTLPIWMGIWELNPVLGFMRPASYRLTYPHWWRRWDLNPLPSVCKTDALPAELHPLGIGGRIRTYTGLVLNQAPLPIGLRRHIGRPGRIRTHTFPFLRRMRLPFAPLALTSGSVEGIRTPISTLAK